MVTLRSVLGEPDHHRSWRLPRSGKAPRLILAVVVIATGVVLGAGLGPAGDPPPEAAPAPSDDAARPDPAATSASTSTSTSTSTTAAIRLWPAAALKVEGREVETDEGRWEVGADGDLVAIGDWDCDRLPTPAVLRPATGEVAVFDRWAGDAPEPARPVTTIPGATDVRATGQCGELVVLGATGDEHVVDTRPRVS